MKSLFLVIFSLVLFSSLSAFAATAPDPPTNLVATPVKPNQVNLFWSAPANNGGAGVNNYKIEFKTGSGSWSVLAT
ncbi:MAG: fibronectin type III domain-containing protein, partial [Candidatus Nitrosotenuis sp.]